MVKLPFRKMNGLGNDFVVLDARARVLGLSADMARQIADREGGIGCDQVVVIGRSARADASMRIFNADGSEVSACGNATRCVAWLLASETGNKRLLIEARAGLLRATVESLDRITIDMGEPRFAWPEIPLSRAVADTSAIDLGEADAPGLGPFSAVNIGNPHAVFWVSDAGTHDLARLGPGLEHHPLFPERANISIAEVVSRDRLRLRTWERGAGLTRACGTAACAAAVAGARKGVTDRQVEVLLPGGSLSVAWTAENRMLMTGPAQLDFEGELAVEDTLAEAGAARLT